MPGPKPTAPPPSVSLARTVPAEVLRDRLTVELGIALTWAAEARAAHRAAMAAEKAGALEQLKLMEQLVESLWIRLTSAALQAAEERRKGSLT